MTEGKSGRHDLAGVVGLLVVRVSLFWGYVALVGTSLVPALRLTLMTALRRGE